MKILFTGDVNFRGIENINEKISKKILEDILPYTEKADFVIPNLECPLGDKEKFAPIKKAGPNLICGEENICFLKKMGAYGVTLANNHIGDYGEGALNNTLKVLDESNIKYAGAGENIFRAYNAMRLEKGDIKVSILSVCENEFGIAEENTAGSAGYNERKLYKRISKEKEYSDFTVVVFHGGNEHNPLPSPDTAERYRFICDMGADAVIATHTHCPQGYEIYDGKPIVYSMGNFFFESSEKKSANDPWYYGYVTVLDLEKTKTGLEIIPYKFSTEKITVFDGEEREKMLEYINTISAIIKNPTELKKCFEGWCAEHMWIPQLPENICVLSDYNAAGNYDLLKCEAHLSQAKQALEILFNDNLSETAVWTKKVEKLQKMPV